MNSVTFKNVKVALCATYFYSMLLLVLLPSSAFESSTNSGTNKVHHAVLIFPFFKRRKTLPLKKFALDISTRFRVNICAK